MPFDPDDNLFLLPGPVKIHPRVLRAMSVPAMAHRGPEFLALNKRFFQMLKDVHATSAPVVPVTGSGTAAADMAIGSLLAKSDRVVVLRNGKFGERLAQLCTRYADAAVVEAPWGRPPPVDDVRAALEEGAKALAFVHNETSTGMTNPLPELVSAARDAGAIVVVDAITSLGGLPLRMDEMKLDAVISGSQKCLGGPPGLSFLALSSRAAGGLTGHPALYLDARSYLKKHAEDNTPFTPATHLHLAMMEALGMLLDETLEARWRRVALQARAVRAAGAALGLDLYPDPAYASDTVTAFRYPSGADDKAVRGALKRYGVIVGGAQDEIKGKVFRFGHMGTVTWGELAGGIALLERVLANAGHKFDHGAGVAAFNEHVPAEA